MERGWQMIESPSHLAVAGLGLKPEGTMPCPENEICAVCGAPIAAGEICDEMVLPPSFTNHSSLAYMNNKYRCGACTAVMTRGDFQMGLATAIFSEDGYYSIMKGENRAWFLLNPPEPPFAVCVQNARMQHIVWRAPVSLSKEVILIRVGEQVVRIRRKYLMDAREVAILLNEKRAESEQKRGGRPTAAKLESPFVNDWKFQSASGGNWKGWVLKLLEEGAITEEEFRPLTVLNGAEAWALNAVLHDAPVKPEPLVTK